MAPPKRPWFRLYVEIVWDRKVRRLNPAHRWLWVTVLACARQSPQPGVLLVTRSEPMGPQDIADASALTVSEVGKGLRELHKAGMIERDDERQAWFIPKWNERQFESDETTKRTTKHRSKERSINGDVAPPETEDREQKTENTPLPPETGGSRANGTSKRQLAARDRYQSALADAEDCDECNLPAFKCTRHHRRLSEAEAELRDLNVPRDVWRVSA